MKKPTKKTATKPTKRAHYPILFHTELASVHTVATQIESCINAAREARDVVLADAAQLAMGDVPKTDTFRRDTIRRAFANLSVLEANLVQVTMQTHRLKSIMNHAEWRSKEAPGG